MKYENVSSAIAQQKIDNILKSGAEYIISTDYSCLMHLNGYIKKQGLKKWELEIESNAHCRCFGVRLGLISKKATHLG
jgi:Fe-S oxidoreductase